MTLALLGVLIIALVIAGSLVLAFAATDPVPHTTPAAPPRRKPGRHRTRRAVRLSRTQAAFAAARTAYTLTWRAAL